ncbi:MAG: hypothetical protein IIA45_07545 [Bacteroidetes bacterium]|nr:hypothetical protein [Bacteroidota bacterium]
MKITAFYFAMVLGILIFSNSLQAQESNFDPNNLKIEYFNDEGVRDGVYVEKDNVQVNQENNETFFEQNVDNIKQKE